MEDHFCGYGENGRIGLIYPNTGWCMEPEFYAMSPPGIVTCTTRLLLEDVTEASILKLKDQAGAAAALLSGAKPDVVLFGCTSGSFIGGRRFDEQLAESMEAVSGGIPSITTASAVAAAAKALGAQKVAVGTPYVSRVNIKAQRYLEDNGFDVVRLVGLEMVDDEAINSLSLDHVEDLIRRTNAPEADIVMILCTSVKGIPIIEKMEKEIGKPVITAIQASFWRCMQMLGWTDPIVGFGSLLRHALRVDDGTGGKIK